MTDTRRVIIYQQTVDGVSHVITVPYHTLPLPRIGECIYYGCTLEIVDIIHHYSHDRDSRYGYSHSEIITK